MTKNLAFLSFLVLATCSRSGTGISTLGANDVRDPAAVGDSSLGDPSVAHPIAPSPSAAEPHKEDASAGFVGWKSWNRKTPARFQSKAHGNVWVHVYVEHAATKAFDAKKGPYPVGARIAKSQFTSESAEAPKNLTVMKKMPPGYDPDNGDWYYGVYKIDGTPIKEGKMLACIGCHTRAADRDYVFANTK